MKDAITEFVQGTQKALRSEKKPRGMTSKEVFKE